MLHFLRRVARGYERILIGVGIAAAVTLPYAFFVAPPLAYPVGATVHVETGQTVSDVAVLLKERHAISSTYAFKIAVRLLTDSGVRAGSYSLATRQNIFALAYRLVTGDSGLTPKRVLVPEGSTIADMAEIYTQTLGDFETKKFLSLAKGQEGYLFPDTYYFLPGTPPDVVVQTMRSTYESKLGPMRPDIASSTHSEHDILTMASILEREARKPETMKIIAGILWKRIQIGMPLQVDAVFGYIKGSDTYSPTFDDLKIDSPYNTYTHKGLPPTPIASPGLDAIMAAIHPTATAYLYYLTGKDGKMYYAKTFDAHVTNRVHLK